MGVQKTSETPALAARALMAVLYSVWQFSEEPLAAMAGHQSWWWPRGRPMWAGIAVAGTVDTHLPLGNKERVRGWSYSCLGFIWCMDWCNWTLVCRAAGWKTQVGWTPFSSLESSIIWRVAVRLWGWHILSAVLCRRSYFASHHNGLPGRLWVKANIACEREAKPLWKSTVFKGTASTPSGLDVGGKTSQVSAYVQIE